MADLARGERIKGLREERHLTQPAVADEIGVTLRAYQAWEATGGIRWDNAKKLARFFGVDVQELWSGHGTTGPTPDPFARNGDMPDADLRAELTAIRTKLDTILKGLGLDKPAEKEPAEEATEVVATLESQRAKTGPAATSKKKRPANQTRRS